MAGRSKAMTKLPETIRQELFRRAAGAGLGDYRELSAWLAGLGHPIGKSSLQRALQPFAGELDLITRAKFLQTTSGRRLQINAAVQAVAMNALAVALKRLMDQRMKARRTKRTTDALPPGAP